MSLQFDGFLSKKFQNFNFTKVEIFFKKSDYPKPVGTTRVKQQLIKNV